jgi:hypothetical protein
MTTAIAEFCQSTLTCPPIKKYLISKDNVHGLMNYAITIVNDLAKCGETCNIKECWHHKKQAAGRKDNQPVVGKAPV